MKLTSDTDMGMSFFSEQHTLKYGDVHEKFNFLKIQDLRPLNTCQKHFEMLLLISSRWVWNLRKVHWQWYKFFYGATAIAKAVYHKNMTENMA